jgi:hypothetical protein
MGCVTKELCLPSIPRKCKKFFLLQNLPDQLCGPVSPLLSGNWARFPRGYGVRGVKLTTQLPQIPRSCKLYLHCPSRLRGLYMEYLISDPVYVCMYVKGKGVPLQAWSGPEGSRKLRFPDYTTTAQDGGKVVSLTHRPPLPTGNAPGTHFS